MRETTSTNASVRAKGATSRTISATDDARDTHAVSVTAEQAAATAPAPAGERKSTPYVTSGMSRRNASPRLTATAAAPVAHIAAGLRTTRVFVPRRSAR